ncbi:MAG: hypothetical protein PUC06_08020 [Oscillospiraceae bacterium]|nr:hypothetical protein [Oscillospiraceae bacterium]
MELTVFVNAKLDAVAGKKAVDSVGIIIVYGARVVKGAEPKYDGMNEWNLQKPPDFWMKCRK